MQFRGIILLLFLHLQAHFPDQTFRYRLRLRLRRHRHSLQTHCLLLDLPRT